MLSKKVLTMLVENVIICYES